MSRSEPTIAVVIETLNLDMGPAIDLPAVIAGLARQTYSGDKIDIVVVVDATNPTLSAFVRDTYPGVRLVETTNSTYYTMKNAGAAVTTADIIAILDSDCVPGPEWAESFVRQIDGGADVVGGRTRYAEGQPFAQTFNFFNFGYVQADARGVANSFLPNNVAFKRDVFRQHPFDERIRRSGASHLLCQQLKARGYRVVYEPKMSATHNSYGLGEEMLMRVKAGYDTVNLDSFDTDRVLQESAYMRAGAPALFVVCLNRIIFDWRTAVRNRKDLNLSLLQIPYFFVVSPVIRVIELVSGLITVLRPHYFRDKYKW